jgi:succinate dehydrogenase / fumarate reductase cytochrome b subunit
MDAHFVLRKIHSLLGVIPVGLFLCFHLFMNSKSISESETHPFSDVVESIEGFHPSRAFLIAVEILFIFLPLLLHGIYGIAIWWQGQSNVLKHRYARNWMYSLQRWSGLVVFVFLILHVYQTRLSGSLPDGAWPADQLFARMNELLGQPAIMALYIVGTVASCFHFANGLWLVGITWGITIGPRSQKYSTVLAVAVGVVLLVLGGVALYGFAANAPVVPLPKP